MAVELRLFPVVVGIRGASASLSPMSWGMLRSIQASDRVNQHRLTRGTTRRILLAPELRVKESTAAPAKLSAGKSGSTRRSH